MTVVRRADVAEQPDDLTPAWLSRALDRPVSGVELRPIGTGQIGTNFLLDLAYPSGSSGPASLVAKLAAPDADARSRVGEGYVKEVGFYTQLAGTVDVRVPGCWFGAMADDGQCFTLLLDDLSPARPGVQRDGCTPDQARAAVDNLAGLHAPRWNDDSLHELEFLHPTDAGAADFIGTLHREATTQFLERYGDALSDDDARTLRQAADATGTWLLARSRPFGVVHGDYRLDNLMFAADGEVTALDWQTTSTGPPLRDVAYFLGNSLETEARAMHEEDLVAGYHRALLDRGVTGYDVDACWTDYRLGQLQGPLITVLGAIYATAERGAAGDDMFLAMATRSCAAIRDLRSLDLL